jgi:hypothetical protein
MKSQPDLLQIVDALRPSRSLTRGLYRRQKERNQDGDDGNHHQKLDEGETPPASALQTHWVHSSSQK